MANTSGAAGGEDPLQARRRGILHTPFTTGITLKVGVALVGSVWAMLLAAGCGDYGKELPPMKVAKSGSTANDNATGNNSSGSATVNPFPPGNGTQPEGNQTKPAPNPAPPRGPLDKRLLELAKEVIRDARGKVVILDLRQSGVMDRDLPGLAAFPDLKFLYLYDTRVSDVAVVHLRNLSNLALLGITATDFTEQGRSKLRQALPGCNIVH